jgi:hypothetical protein
MKPSEYFKDILGWADGGHFAANDEKMEALILGLLEAVEGARVWRRPSMGGNIDFEAQSEESIVRAALRLKQQEKA